MELYYDKDKKNFAVLISIGYGAGWSTWNDSKLAYDKKVVEFWLQHKDNKKWMETVNIWNEPESDSHKEAREFFTSIGYDEPYMGGFHNIIMKWVPIGSKWVINEYDGFEKLVLESDIKWENVE